MMTLGKTNRGWRLLLLVCLAAAPSVYAVENGGRVVGEAHDLESDELLYREIYCANGNPDEMEVIYRDEAGGLIARKVLDYGSGATTPSFVQRNLYSSEIIEVKLQDSKVSMSPAKKNAFCSRSPSATAWWSCVSNRPPAITRPKPTSASNWSCLTGLSACW
jgi:hypothetical protein